MSRDISNPRNPYWSQPKKERKSSLRLPPLKGAKPIHQANNAYNQNDLNVIQYPVPRIDKNTNSD